MKMIRAMALLALAGLWAGLQAQETLADLVAGQTEKQVISALGKPRGRIGSAAKTYLYYPRGKIVLQNGVVTEVDFVSVSEQLARDARRAEVEAQLQANRDRDNALLAQLLEDPAYLAMSTRDRMVVVERFQREHPAAQARTEYQALRTIYYEEMSAHEVVARLQNEVARAQAQAAAAQSQAATAQQDAAAAQQRADQAQKSAQSAAYNQNIAYTTPVLVSYAPPVSYVQVGNGQTTVVTPYSYYQPYCAPVAPVAPRSGFSLAISGANYQFRVGSAVDTARANFWYNPARRLN